MLELLGSCFEDQEDRPADAAVLAEKLAALLKPQAGQVKHDEALVSLSPPKEVVNSIGMKLKLIPAGEFQMGSTEERTTEKDRDILVDDHAGRSTWVCTRSLSVNTCKWRRRTRAISRGGDALPGRERLLVRVRLTFCNVLSQKEGLPPFYTINGADGRGSRLERAGLPAADRGGVGICLPGRDHDTVFVRRQRERAGSICMVFRELRQPDAPGRGERSRTPFGLHDMHGNVWEWCWDGYDPEYYKQSPERDPLGPDQTEHRVYRGGCWHDDPRIVRSAFRSRNSPMTRSRLLGFPRSPSSVRWLSLTERVLGVSWALFSAETGWHRIEQGTSREGRP